MGSDRDGSGAGSRSKVARLLRREGLDGAGDELEQRWTGDGGQRTSLRDLADWFNRELLRATMERAGLSPMDSDVERRYETLTSADASEGRKAEIRNELTRAGVEVESLRSAFVSHQSIHTYLTDVRGVEAPTPESDVVDNDVEAIQRLLGRTTSVAEGTLERHRSADRIALGEFDVLLDLRVLCRDCGTDSDVVNLLERGGCDCSTPTDDG